MSISDQDFDSWISQARVRGVNMDVNPDFMEWIKKDRDEWKRRALEAEEAGRAIMDWEGANCDGYADKASNDCPFCKMRAVLNSINGGISATDIEAK